jgi:hypothetical protein
MYTNAQTMKTSYHVEDKVKFTCYQVRDTTILQIPYAVRGFSDVISDFHQDDTV